MARRIEEKDFQAIEDAVRRHPEGVTAQGIADELGSVLPRRTLQYRLRYLVDNKRLVMEGKGRWARYRVPRIAAAMFEAAGRAEVKAQGNVLVPLSKEGAEVQEYVRRPPEARKPVGYDRVFLDSYRPNDTFYLSPADRAHLRQIGTPKIGASSFFMIAATT